jgi:hypothetical protein
MRVLFEVDRSLAGALGLGRALLERAERERVPYAAASVARGPAVVLGAGQRAGRVVRLGACAGAGVAVLRRATAGTAVYVGGRGIVWTLALPHVAAIVADATPRSLLNRNVRGFLEGFRRAGAAAHYFGREWISLRKRPAAVMGFEGSAGGGVLIEVIAGVDAPPAVPGELATEEERAVDRWLGKEPAALGEVVGGDPAEIARDIVRAVARGGVEEIAGIVGEDVAPVTREDDPMPEGLAVGPGVPVPVGWIDTGVDRASGRVWIGGDVLVASFARDAVAAGAAIDADEVAVEGATLGDLAAAARTAAA